MEERARGGARKVEEGGGREGGRRAGGEEGKGRRGKGWRRGKAEGESMFVCVSIEEHNGDNEGGCFRSLRWLRSMLL